MKTKKASKADRLNEVLEAALNALDPLMNAYAVARGMRPLNLTDDSLIEVGKVTVKKLREAKLAVDGLYEFYKCRG